MIYLGYDHIQLQTVARYDGQRIILQENERAYKIMDALWAIGKDFECQYADIQMAIRMIPYSDQAWSDLLSIEQ